MSQIETAQLDREIMFTDFYLLYQLLIYKCLVCDQVHCQILWLC